MSAGISRSSARCGRRAFRSRASRSCGGANIPFDETEEELLELFFSFLRCFREGQPLSCLELPEGHAPTLPQLEQYCRKLDLYFSFSKAFGCPIDRDALYDKREDAAESINQILLYKP